MDMTLYNSEVAAFTKDEDVQAVEKNVADVVATTARAVKETVATVASTVVDAKETVALVKESFSEGLNVSI